MSLEGKAVVAGYEVRGEWARPVAGRHALVELHRLGRSEIGFLRPSEARELAAALIASADFAESDPSEPAP